MDCQQLLNNIGLIIDIIGALLMFIYTPRVNLMITMYTKEDEPIVRKKERKINSMIKTGMFLLFIGFSLQIISNFI